MEYVATIAALVATPVIVGWILGRNNIDPETDYGRKYYDE